MVPDDHTTSTTSQVTAVYEADLVWNKNNGAPLKDTLLKDALTLFWQQSATLSSDQHTTSTADCTTSDVLTDEMDALQEMTQVSAEKFRFYQDEPTSILEDDQEISSLIMQHQQQQQEHSYHSFGPTATDSEQSDVVPPPPPLSSRSTSTSFESQPQQEQHHLNPTNRNFECCVSSAQEESDYESDDDDSSLGSLDTTYTPPGASLPVDSPVIQPHHPLYDPHCQVFIRPPLQDTLPKHPQLRVRPIPLLRGKAKFKVERASTAANSSIASNSNNSSISISSSAGGGSNQHGTTQRKSSSRSRHSHGSKKSRESQRNKSTTSSERRRRTNISSSNHSEQQQSETHHSWNTTITSNNQNLQQQQQQQQQSPNQQQQMTERMPRHSCHVFETTPSCFSGDDADEEPYFCDSMLNPFFFLNLWEPYDSKQKGDDETLATYDDELSYEDEGYVNVLVAVQATVLGGDYPAALDKPKQNMPLVWGNNLVGMVQAPKGNTVHSRKFPPGSRVASICAWSAASHKPYVVSNSSHLLPVPPLDGLHLDGTEVGVVVAAYLPAFQAIHHGRREHRHLACEPTALEGHRILILAHSETDNSQFNRSVVDAQVQAAVRMALWAGARDVHVTVPKVGNAKRNIFGNDYRVRLLDTPADDWVPILKERMDLVLDYTNGFSILDRKESTMDIVQAVQAPKGRYVGCLGEDCCSHTLNCREEGRSSNTSLWTGGLSFFQRDDDCSSPAFLPEARNIRHVVEWTTMCMKMKRASLFDFHALWKEDRGLAQHDFRFLLDLLAKRQIRPHVANILDIKDFPACGSFQPKITRSMTGAVVCEPWSQFKDLDDLSCCSDLS